MLTHLAIRNFAIVDQAELDLDRGMTVLTGETGAGKSILIDALNLALGDRADSAIIRQGADRAEVTASFDISAAGIAQHWLRERELESDGDCLLRRTVSREGRSKGYINGQPVPMQSLRELGEMLVDIHGQHEHQSLLRPDQQRQLLDDYAGHVDLANSVAASFQRWKDALHELRDLAKASLERDSRRDLLHYQIQELDNLALGAGELDEINQEHSRLANAARLLEAGHRELQILFEEEGGSVVSLLARTVRELELLQQLDQRLSGLTQLLTSAVVDVEEAVTELRHYLDTLELDPERLSWIETRLAGIVDLARKHRITPAELPALLLSLEAEWNDLQTQEQRLDALENEIAESEQAFRKLAAVLTLSRTQAARELGEKVNANMQQLGMAGGRFEAVLEELSAAQASLYGLERVEFRVSANSGQPLRALHKVASGGELSRISLAIQVIIATRGSFPTLIFDEVDVGIGGGIAEIVGKQLNQLSQTRQVLCVTHLAQVAAQGTQHILVSKHTGRAGSGIRIRKLSPPERPAEIARMLGGVDITEKTLLHAVEMLELAQKAQKLLTDQAPQSA